MLQALKSSFGWKLGAKRFDPDRIVLCARRKDPIAVPLIFEFCDMACVFCKPEPSKTLFPQTCVRNETHFLERGRDNSGSPQFGNATTKQTIN